MRTTDVRDRMLAENERDRLAPRAHQARPLRQLARGQRRLGALAGALLGHAAADLGVRRPRTARSASAPGRSPTCASAAARSPTTSTAPTSTRSRCAARPAAARCAASGETIDAWYDSGSMPFAQFHYPFEGEELFEERFPADFISEAIDQTRGWFYSLLAVSVLVFDQTSYRNCVCLGLILDPEGQKMSKSRGNVVDPWEVIDRHGADAFRWYYFTAQQPWAGYRFSADTVGESVRQFMLTLWNTYSFWVLYANAEGLEREDLGRLDAGGGRVRRGDELDRWALSRLQGTTRTVIEQHGRLRLHHAPAARSRPTSRSSPTGTCGSRAGASGRATRPPSPPCATACSRSASAAGAVHALPRRRDLRSTSPAARRGVRRAAGLGAPARLPGARPRARRRPSSRPRWRPSAARSSSGRAARAQAEVEGAPAAAQGGHRRHRRRARGDRARWRDS